MKHIFTTALSILLCAAMLCGCMLSVDAARAPLMIGDADLDYSVTIMDATAIQRYIAGLQHGVSWYTTELYEAICDADGDGDVTIIDATAIQRDLAELKSSFVGGGIWDYYIGDSAWHSTAQIMDENGSSYEVCYVGVPVTFTARVIWGAKPQTYSLSIDGKVVREAPADNYKTHTFTHTFTEAGEYTVSTNVKCQYGVTGGNSRTVRVIPLPDNGRPVIMGAAFFDASRMNSGDGVLTVTAVGGTAPYQYKYEVLTDIQFDEYELGFEGESVYSTGYIDQNTLDLSKIGNITDPSRFTTVKVKITVRDQNGNESDPVTAVYESYELVA